MQKAHIINALVEIGYTKDLALETYENAFRNLPYQKHVEMLESFVNLSAQAQGKMSKENQIMTHTNNNTNVAVSVDFVRNTEDGLPYFAILTPSNSNGTVLNIGEKFSGMAQSAMNAYTDYFHFDRAGHLEVGLHLTMPLEQLNMLPYVEDAGVVGKNYTGKTMIPAPRVGDWGVVNVNGGRFRTTKVAYNDRSKYDAIVNKHNFVDMLLQGFTLKVHLFKVNRQWLTKVVDTLSNPDKMAAWESYQANKNEAAVRATAYKSGKKLAKMVNDYNEGKPVKGTDIIGEMERILNITENIAVVINGVETLVQIDDLHAGFYGVINSRGKQVTSVNVTGSNSSKETLAGFSLRGWKLSQTR